MGRHTLTAATSNQLEGSIRAAAGAENRTRHDCEAEERSVPRSRSRRKRPTTTRYNNESNRKRGRKEKPARGWQGRGSKPRTSIQHAQ
eukprot:6165599-Pyramimonas_sp.AAC.1